MKNRWFKNKKKVTISYELKLLHMLIDNVLDRIYAKDRQGRFIIVNKAVINKLGKKKLDEVIGKTDYDFYSKELADHYYADDQSVMESGRALLNREESTVDSKKKRKWTLTTKVPVKDSKGKVIGLVGIGRDITRRKAAQLKLDETISKLKQSNEELQQFAYIASHDLQEPLRMVASYVALIEQKYSDKLDTAGHEFIGFAVEGAERMQVMINELLHFSRITTQGKTFQKTEMDNVLKKVLVNLKIVIEESGGEVKYDPLPEIIADETQMERLLQNLIANAVKYRNDQPPKIYVSAKKKKGEYLFAVRDNGIGINKNYQEKIFKIFQRLHTRKEYSGTGIGLSVCKKIVERHGGNIWVDSEEGKGSTFYFSIPVKK